jgi:hypothetical protein
VECYNTRVRSPRPLMAGVGWVNAGMLFILGSQARPWSSLLPQSMGAFRGVRPCPNVPSFPSTRAAFGRAPFNSRPHSLRQCGWALLSQFFAQGAKWCGWVFLIHAKLVGGKRYVACSPKRNNPPNQPLQRTRTAHSPSSRNRVRSHPCCRVR